LLCNVSIKVSMANSRLRLRLSSSNTSLDVKPLADLQQHSNALGRRAFGQQVDLKIQMRAPIRQFAHSILPHQHECGH
jgi:hypothetical protein